MQAEGEGEGERKYQADSGLSTTLDMRNLRTLRS